MKPTELTNSVPDNPDVPQASPSATCSAETWRTLASRLADEAEVVIQNAHWEVSYGSGDLRNTIKAIRTQYRADMMTPPNQPS